MNVLKSYGELTSALNNTAYLFIKSKYNRLEQSFLLYDSIVVCCFLYTNGCFHLHVTPGTEKIKSAVQNLFHQKNKNETYFKGLESRVSIERNRFGLHVIKKLNSSISIPIKIHFINS